MKFNISKESKDKFRNIVVVFCVVFLMAIFLGRCLGILPSTIAKTKPVQPVARAIIVEQESLTQDKLEVSICQVSSKYPKEILQWCNLITKYAHEEDLKPDLIAGVIMIESWFPKSYKDGYQRCPDGPVTNSCTSVSGAIGIMQVMASDGISGNRMCINGLCFSDRPTVKQLRNPEKNIKTGTRLLARYIKKQGTVRGGLMAYHGFSGNPGYYANKVKEYMSEYGAN